MNAPSTELDPSQEGGRFLLLLPVLEAVEAWRRDASAASIEPVASAIAGVAAALDLQVGRLRLAAPPLPELDIDLGAGTSGAEIVLRAPGQPAPVGSIRIGGDRDRATDLARALEMVFISARAGARADRAEDQLRALDQAVRGISGVLDVNRVLQTIVDQVRELVQAQYAALGIVDAQGAIERFITSGISDEERARIGDLPHGRGLLGLIIRDNRTYRIPDIGTHPERYGFPPNHPEMRSFLGMPITFGDATVGRLYLTNKLGAVEFSEDDQALVEMFALHAGIAIQNARFHDQVGRLAIVDERDRISRDLHDSVIQAIYAQTLALDDVPELIADEPGEAASRVDEAIDALHAVIRDIRNFIFGLRPALLESGSLIDGLEHLATELRRNGGIDVSISVPEHAAETEAIPIEVVAELLAVTREALSNIARHAAATRASVDLDATPSELRLELTDNGRGFDGNMSVADGHHGLANMRARIEALAGTIEVMSRPETGTRIIISVPRRAAARTETDR